MQVGQVHLVKVFKVEALNQHLIMVQEVVEVLLLMVEVLFIILEMVELDYLHQ